MLATGAVAGDAATASLLVPEWVVFACENHWFGFPVTGVREIVSPRPFTRLPGCAPVVCGLIGLRGRAVTVFDFGVAFSLRPAAAYPDHRLLLVEYGERVVGFAVEEVIAVARTRTRGLSVPGEVLRALDVEREDLLGIGEWEERTFLAVDPGKILSRLLV
jgi:purine-binding chemotaxis protein CheW